MVAGRSLSGRETAPRPRGASRLGDMNTFLDAGGYEILKAGVVRLRGLIHSAGRRRCGSQG
jgi:hypothetical protein